jgi:hypothetical protein
LRGRACARANASRDDPLDTEPGVDADLGGDLVGGTRAQRTAVADVRALGAFADDDEVDSVRRHTVDVQRAAHAGEELRRPQVDVVLEREADGKQDATLEDTAWDAGVADRPEQDRVLLLELFEHAARQSLTGGVPPAGTEVVLGGRHLETASRRCDLEDLEPLSHDLGADPVAADDSEVEGVGHWVLLGVRGMRLRRQSRSEPRHRCAHRDRHLG